MQKKPKIILDLDDYFESEAFIELKKLNLPLNIDDISEEKLRRALELLSIMINGSNIRDKNIILYNKHLINNLRKRAIDLKIEIIYDDMFRKIDDLCIRKYESCFNDLTFFNGNSFILDNIENFRRLINRIGIFLDNYDLIVHQNGIKSISLDDNLKFVQEFFDGNNIPLDVKSLIKSDVISFTPMEESNIRPDNFNIINHGSSFKDSNNSRKINIITRNLILDGSTIVHELMHYYNQPIDKRNFTSDLLTEAVSFACELIYIYSILGAKHKINVDDLYMLIERTLYNYCLHMYHVYKLISLYKKEGTISKDTYDKNYKDNNYNQMIEYFDYYICSGRNIIRDTWYVLCFPLSIYLFEEYKKNNDFFSSIMMLNDNLNFKSFSECMNIIGIKTIDDFFEKIDISLKSYMKNIEHNYKTVKQSKK